MTDNPHEIEQPESGDEGTTPEFVIPAELLKDGKIAGKFEATPEGFKEFQKSYWNIVEQRKEREIELAAIKAERGNLTPAGPKKSALKRLHEIGLPEEDFREAVSELMAETLGPALQIAEAQDRVSTAFPTFAKDRPKILAWLQEDPERSALFNQMKTGSPEGALQWATLQYERAHPAPTEPDAEEKSAARIPGGGSRRRSAVSPDVVDQKKFDEAVKYFQETGNKEPVWAEGLKNIKPWGQ